MPLPLAMAFAIASGAKPEQGIYTAITAGFMVSVFGGSRLQIAGSTGAFIVVLIGIRRLEKIAYAFIAQIDVSFLRSELRKSAGVPRSIEHFSKI